MRKRRGDFPSYHLLSPNVDLHRWYSQAPHLREGPDGR